VSPSEIRQWAKQKANEWCNTLGYITFHVLRNKLPALINEAIEEGKRQDREWLKAQDNGYYAVSTDGISHQGTGAYWASKLEGIRDKRNDT
jgi:hypothetical protein